MIEFQHQVEIDRSPDEVFALLADVERAPVWQASVVAATRTSPEPLRVGSTVQMTWKAMGRKRRVDVHVAAFTPSRLLAFAGDAGFADYYCGFELTPARDGGTVLASRNEFRLHGLWKLAQPLLAGEIRREVAGEIAELKRTLEANAPHAAAAS